MVGTIEPTGHDETFGQRSHTSYAPDGLVVEPDFFPPLFSTRFFNFTFFFQDGLAPGAHELVVTNLNGTGSVGPMVFWLDYFQVEGGGADAVEAVAVASGTGTTAAAAVEAGRGTRQRRHPHHGSRRASLTIPQRTAGGSIARRTPCTTGAC